MPTNQRTVLGRRRLLAGLGATALASSAGCLGDPSAVLDRDPSRQVSLSIRTLPRDDDAAAMTIARYLADRLGAVGIDADVIPMDHDAFLRSVLINYDFDLYVGRFPANRSTPPDPDFLRPLVHSRFAESPGWQNPFGFADPTVDEYLERQRRLAGPDRTRVLYDLQEAVVEQRPFSVIAFPDAIRAVRPGRFEAPPDETPDGSLRYLSLDPSGETDWVVRLARTDGRVTRNLNPLSVEYRSDGAITGLLYDPLCRQVAGRFRPWLAEEVRWSRPDDAEGPVATVSLRPGVTWHDGRPLTPSDVVFSYEFQRDTSLGEAASPIPAPEYERLASVLETVELLDDGAVRFRFLDCTEGVAARALSLPVLPEHVWRPLATPAEVAGIDAGRDVTEALLWNNTDPVGSGPLAVDQVLEGTELGLVPFGEHVVFDDRGPDWFEDPPSYDRLVFRIVPADETAVALVDAGEVDAADSSVDPTTVSEIGRSGALELSVERTWAFYHVGFNVRRSPLGNYQFRRAVATLVDEAHLVDRALNGYGLPAVSPLTDTANGAPTLAWEGSDPSLPFPGEDGQLDVERARRAFRRAGFRYADDGRLLATS